MDDDLYRIPLRHPTALRRLSRPAAGEVDAADGVTTGVWRAVYPSEDAITVGGG